MAAARLVHLSDDGVANALQVFEVLLEVVLVGVVVRAQPVGVLGKRVLNQTLVIVVDLVGQLLLIFDGVAHLINVVLQLVLGVDLVFEQLVFLSELLSVGDHPLDFVLGEAALVVGDRDGLLLVGALLVRRDGKDGVLVNLKSYLDLRHTTGRRGNSV